jgi:hypothetical protein
MALTLAGCARDQQLAAVAAAPPPKPPPQRGYFKEGASSEEFQRTKAGCLVRAESAAPGFNAPWSWFSIYQNCMRADGWVLVEKK